MKNYQKRLRAFMNRFGIQPTEDEMKAAYQQHIDGDGGNTIGWEWIGRKGLTVDAQGKEINGWHDTYCGDTLVDLGRMLVEAKKEW